MCLRCTDLLKITYPHRVILPLLLPMKAAQSFGFLCVLELLESGPGLVHSRVACPCLAATHHVLVPPWQSKENSSGGLRLQTLPTVISDPWQNSCSQWDLPRNNWNVEMDVARVRVRHSLGWWWVCQIAHQWAKFHSWNYSGHWGRGNLKFGPLKFLFLWWFWSQPVSRSGLFYNPRGFSPGPWCYKSWSLGDEPFPAVSFLCSLEVSYFIFFIINLVL